MSQSLSLQALDPYTASSLLQKAIRRGEVEIARAAAVALYRHRGNAVWRRLSVIAAEDIGIADPSLLNEVVGLFADKKLRDVLGPPEELVDHVVMRLAAAVKDRSADYLYCFATNLTAPQREECLDQSAARLGDTYMAALALIERAESALKGTPQPLGPSEQNELSAAVNELVRLRLHPFVKTLPALWDAAHDNSRVEPTVEEKIPPTEYVRGIPLFAFDKHTAIGKRALGMLARENEKLAEILKLCVPSHAQERVVGIAAFYLDAAPVSRRLNWSLSKPLAEWGFQADMIGAGCPPQATRGLYAAVESALDHLNAIRRRLVNGRFERG
jgi:hypothetical protein